MSKCPFPEHHGHGDSHGVGPADNAADAIAKAAIIVAAIDLAGWIFRVLEFALICSGLLVVGIGAGYIGVRVWLRRRRRAAAGVALMPYQSQGQPSQWQAPGSVGHQAPGQVSGPSYHLHLPEGMSAEDLARLLGGGR
jgi:hypothetical protein